VAETDFAARVAAVRRFNRFYTKQIGVLHQGYLESPFSQPSSATSWGWTRGI